MDNKEVIMAQLVQFKAESDSYSYLGGYQHRTSHPFNFEDKSAPVFVSNAWTSGGLTGGNCWGSSADTPVEAAPEEDLTHLENFLDKYYPDLSFRTWRKLNQYIQYIEFGCSEYYGNYYTYRFSYIKFEDIARVLAGEDD